MDYLELLYIIPRSIFSLFVLFIATKILGKKQVSELSLFDYAIGMSIGNFTADMTLDLEAQFINGAMAILTFGVIGYLISKVTMKSIFLRRVIIGVPTILVSDGKLMYSALKKVKIDINDFQEQARNAGYFNLEDISYAIMEANGKISFLLKDEASLPTKKDLNLKTSKTMPEANIIIDGKLMENNIKNTDRTKEWFVKQLKIKGYNTYESILLATYKDNDLKIYNKNEFESAQNTLE